MIETHLSMILPIEYGFSFFIIEFANLFGYKKKLLKSNPKQPKSNNFGFGKFLKLN